MYLLRRIVEITHFTQKARFCRSYLKSAKVAVPSVHEKGKDSGASVSVAFVVTTLLINATSLMC